MNRIFLAALLCLPTSLRAEIAHQFFLTGHIESFTVDDLTDPLSAAHVTIHGVEVLVPRNLLIQMPARYLTAKDIVDLNPVPVAGETGLALDDANPPIAAMEASVVGNIVGEDHIAGLVWITQHSLAEGAGFIRDIAPDGEIHLVANPDRAAPAQPVTRIRINDPNGVFAPPDPNADERFMVDEANPTIHAGTGYPMCIPHAGAPGECPAQNRPAGAGGAPLTTFVMGNAGLPGSPAGALPIPPCPGCDPTKQAPLMPGDYILFAGTLARDGTGLYVSAHTVEANVGIYTAPGTGPAYIFIEGALIGTQGPLVQREGFPPGVTLPQETQNRLRIEGVTSDPSRPIELYAIDVDPATGDQTLRIFNSVPAQPAPLGRFRLILEDFALTLTDTNGVVKGATRELMAHVGGAVSLDGQPVPDAPLFAHGLVAGQYIAPFEEFIFPENKVIGDPIIPANFECLPFLLLGSGPLETTATPGPVVGQLDPWPEVAPPPATVVCGPAPNP